MNTAFAIMITLSLVGSGHPPIPLVVAALEKSFPTAEQCETFLKSDTFKDDFKKFTHSIEKKLNISKLSSDAKCLDISVKAGPKDDTF